MPSKVPSIVVGAVVAAVLSLLTTFVSAGGDANQVLSSVVSCLCCLGAIGSGVVAVAHYTNAHALTISPGTGAGMGAAAGFLGMLAAALIGLLLQAVGVLPTTEESMAVARESMRAQGLTDEQIEQGLQFSSYLTGPLGTAIFSILGAILGAIGGAIGAALFKKGTADDPALDDTI